MKEYFLFGIFFVEYDQDPPAVTSWQTHLSYLKCRQEKCILKKS